MNILMTVQRHIAAPARLVLRSLKLFQSLLLTIAVASCASSPAPVVDQPTTAREPAWGASLGQRAELDTDRDCLRGALQTAYALVAFRDGRFDDKAIQSAMLDNLPNERIRSLRKAAFAEWQRTHQPASVVVRQFDACIASAGNRLDSSDAWLRCAFATEPATVMLIYRRTQRSLPQAVEAVTPYYPISVDASEIASLAQQVYALEDAEELPFREQLFYECLSTKPPAG
jgi:hypothetical protein